MSDDLRDTLKRIPVYRGELPGFELSAVPATPQALFRQWFDAAVAADVVQPQAMTLSTVDADGRPDARILLLKRQLEDRWGFATSATSAKGHQLTANPVAALTFSWPELGRQVRIRGPVVDAGPAEARADFLARPPASRRESWLPGQSAPLGSRDELARAHARAEQEITAHPDDVPEHWRLYDLVAQEVEFWQADAGRQHVRLQYARASEGRWSTRQLWP